MSRTFEALYAEAEADLNLVLLEVDNAKHTRPDVRNLLRQVAAHKARAEALEARLSDVKAELEAQLDRNHELSVRVAELLRDGGQAKGQPDEAANLREIIRVQEIELRGLRKMTYPIGHTIILANQRRSA